MIIDPLNDPTCLRLLHQECERRKRNPAFIQFALAFISPPEIAAFIRTRPQELDFGDPLDGPRIACVPSQRLRALPGAYTCFEGTGTFLPLADIIDPSTPRTSCTIRVGRGYHTFPVERNRAVILDPDPPPRNAIDAGVYECTRQNGARPSLVEAGEAAEWLFRVAANAAKTPGENRAVRNAAHAMNRSLVTGHPLENLDAIGQTIALAETEAALWGEEGHDALAHAVGSVRNLQQKIDQGLFAGLAKKMGERALEAFVLAQTGPVGLAILNEVRGKEQGKAQGEGQGKTQGEPNDDKKAAGKRKRRRVDVAEHGQHGFLDLMSLH